MRHSNAEIVREYGPFPDADNVGGVTFDGHDVWFAAGGKLNAFDPASGEIQRTLDVPAHADTAFDGTASIRPRRDRGNDEGRPIRPPLEYLRSVRIRSSPSQSYRSRC